MSKEVTMPKYGMSMFEAEIIKWLKNEGEQIKISDELVEVEENKSVHTIESLYSGTLEKILVQEGDIAKVGDVIALISE